MKKRREKLKKIVKSLEKNEKRSYIFGLSHSLKENGSLRSKTLKIVER